MSVRSGFTLGAAGYTPLPRSITKAEETLLSRVFQESDEGSKGYLTRTDIKVAVVQLLGYKPTKYEVNGMLETYGEQVTVDTSGMTKEKFITCMGEKLVKCDEDEEIRHTFMAFDMLCHGFLNLDDLKRVFSKIAPYMSAQTVHSVFRELDQDGDGRVSYKDFEFLMKYNLDDQS